MEDLPTELTTDILSRLPVKTIIQCKLVCNKWRNLVLDSSFANLHLSRSPTPTTGFIIHHKHRAPYNDPGILKLVELEDKVDSRHLHRHHLLSLDLNLVPILQDTGMHHVGSVNGLICLWQYSLKLDLYDTYICNPVTREYMILPRHPFFRDGFALTRYGLGVNSLTGEYKVVQAFQTKVVRNGHKATWMSVLEVVVYTLGRGQWRSLGPVHVPYRHYPFYEFYGPFLKNHCHWIVCDMENTNEKIATFDLDKETFQLFPSPPLVKKIRYHGQSLGILKGCLCNLDTCISQTTIWVMKEYGIKNSWHKEVVITREICVTLKWPLFEPVHPIARLKDGSFLMVFENKLCVFDPRRKTIEDTKMFKPHLSGWAYRPSFLKLQNFEPERVRMF